VLYGTWIDIFCWQVLLSKDVLQMMMYEVTILHDDDSNSFVGPAAVDLRTFLLIMEHSAW
jgi:hypothetical protein